jgi:hypothetical protein
MKRAKCGFTSLGHRSIRSVGLNQLLWYGVASNLGCISCVRDQRSAPPSTCQCLPSSSSLERPSAIMRPTAAPEYPLDIYKNPFIQPYLLLHQLTLYSFITSLLQLSTNHQPTNKSSNTMRFTSILLALPFVASVFAAPVANSDLEVKTVGTFPTHPTNVISIVTELQTSIVS